MPSKKCAMQRSMSIRANATGIVALLLLGCGAPKAGSSASNGSGSGEPASEQVEADPMVGYDLRRLRPRADEPLAAMFDRLRVAAAGEGKRVVVLFSADWCEPCKQLDLELGNTHPRSMIGDVRVLELKEDDWKAAARMDEYNQLRRRWEPALNAYPLVLLLDDEGKRLEEMKEAKQRLEALGVEPTLPLWFGNME